MIFLCGFYFVIFLCKHTIFLPLRDALLALFFGHGSLVIRTSKINNWNCRDYSQMPVKCRNVELLLYWFLKILLIKTFFGDSSLIGVLIWKDTGWNFWVQGETLSLEVWKLRRSVTLGHFVSLANRRLLHFRLWVNSDGEDLPGRVTVGLVLINCQQNSSVHVAVCVNSTLLKLPLAVCASAALRELLS